MNEEQRNYTIKEIEKYNEKSNKELKDSTVSMALSLIWAGLTVFLFKTDETLAGGATTLATIFFTLNSIQDYICYERYNNQAEMLEYFLEMDKLKTRKENSSQPSKKEKPKQYFKRGRR